MKLLAGTTSMDPNTAHALKVANQDARKTMEEALPALAMRVFALKGKVYQGFGYHYAMVKTVGALMVSTSPRSYTCEDRVIDEVIFEGLIEDLDRAEAEIAAREAA